MSPDDSPKNPPFPLLRSALTLTVVMAAMAGLACAVIALVGATAQFLPALAAAGVALAAALLALLPLSRAGGKAMHLLPALAMAGMGIRLVVTSAGVLALMLMLDVPTLPLALWALAWYALGLGVEVRLMTGYVSTATPGGKASPAGGATAGQINAETTGARRADAV